MASPGLGRRRRQTAKAIFQPFQCLAEAGLPALFGLSCDDPPKAMSAYVGCIHEDDASQTITELNKARLPGGRYSADFRVVVDGSIRWLRGCALGTVVGGRCRIIGFNLDVTSEYEARAKLNLVNHELKHRVKNLLTLVQSLSHRSFRSSEDKLALHAFYGRLNALAASTDLLFHNDWQALVLGDIIRIAMAGPSGSSEKINCSGQELKVDPAAVFPLLLTIHELSTNAVKYGGFSLAGGGVDVVWTLNDHTMVILWKEHSQLKAIESKGGFGTKLMKRLIDGELKGSFVLELEPDGLLCTIEVPSKFFSNGDIE